MASTDTGSEQGMEGGEFLDDDDFQFRTDSGRVFREEQLRAWADVNSFGIDMHKLYLEEAVEFVTRKHLSCVTVKHILQMAEVMRLPWKTVATAQVLLHRYASHHVPDEATGANVESETLFKDMVQPTFLVVAFACLLLASKLEETLFSLRSMMDKYFVANPDLTGADGVADPASQDRMKAQLQDLIKDREQTILKCLDFKLMVRHLQHFRLLQLFQVLSVPEPVRELAVRVVSTTVMTESVLYERPELAALASLALAARALGHDVVVPNTDRIREVSGTGLQCWWSVFGARTEHLEELLAPSRPFLTEKCMAVLLVDDADGGGNGAEIAALERGGLLVDEALRDLQRPLRKRRYHGCRSVKEYERIKRISEGTYGTVYLARDRASGEVVALKQMKRTVSRSGFPYYMLREILFLFRLHHPNVVAGKAMAVSEGSTRTFYIVMEFIATDMLSLLKHQVSLPREQRIRLSQVKNVMTQILHGVTYMHEQHLMHRDLKLANLLLNKHGVLKVADLGSIRDIGRTNLKLTTQIVTLWYRAPELLMGGTEYTCSIDIWSIGCLFMELLTLKPLFPGRSESETVMRILKILGRPDGDTLLRVYSQLPLATELATEISEARTTRSLARLAPYLSPAGLDFVNSMLEYDPERRISARDALAHPFLQEKPYPQPIDLAKTGMVTPYDERELELEAEVGKFGEVSFGSETSGGSTFDPSLDFKKKAEEWAREQKS